MSRISLHIALSCVCIGLLCRLPLCADTHAFWVDFSIEDSRIDSSFRNNETYLSDLCYFLDSVSFDPRLSLQEVTFGGYVSPEGPEAFNTQLGAERMHALAQWVRSRYDLPDSIISYYLAPVPSLTSEERDMLEQGLYPASFLAMRKATAEFIVARAEPQHMTEISGGGTNSLKINQLQSCADGDDGSSSLRGSVAAYAAPPAWNPHAALSRELIDSTWVHHIYLKTNVAMWAMLIANVAIDFDLSPHWSLSIPVYYSGINYFVETLKFRTFALQPAVRYHFRRGQDGFFVDAHFGMAYYNVAVPGTYRYQDHSMTSPMWGGGIGFGYRMPLTPDRRWKFEVAVGAGVYSLHYDRFRNEHNGKLVDTRKEVYYGLDHVSISFGYMFNVGKTHKK